MDKLSRRMFGLMLVLSVLVSSYLSVVQVVNGFERDSLFKSFSVESSRMSGFMCEFVVGDVLEFRAECDLAVAYSLRVYQNSSLVFEVRGRVFESLLKAYLPLNPPAFAAGGVYVALLDVYVYNNPILGTCFRDSVSYVFGVTSVGTQLELAGEYNGVMRNLRLRANLTDVDCYPVTDETVDFYLQLSGRRRPTNGWVPIGSAKTNATGISTLRLAFNIPSRNYSMKAHHEENGNFGESSAIVNIEIISNMTFGGFALHARSETCIDQDLLLTGDGDVSLNVSSYDPYAGLPMDAIARYTSDGPIDPDFSLGVADFYYDSIDSAGYISTEELVPVAAGPPYIYEASLVWSPNMLGSHKLIGVVIIGEILFGGIRDATWTPENGSPIIIIEEVDLNIRRCPSNISLQHPEAVCSNYLPITVAMSKPTPYVAVFDDFYSVANLGTQFSYNDVDYIIDEPVSSVPIKFYEDDILTYMGSTDQYGLVHFQLHNSQAETDLRVAISASSIFVRESLEKVLFLSKVRTYDKRNTENAPFNLSFTVSNAATGEGVCVGATSLLRAKTSLLNMSILNVPLSITFAKVVSNFTTNASGVAFVPDGSDYLRVHNTTVLEGDVNCDAEVDIWDVAIVAAAYGSYPGHYKWNVDADVNHDNEVDTRDIAITTRNYGKNGDYVAFSNDEQAYLDSQGFALIPPDVETVTFYKSEGASEAYMEFLHKVLDKNSSSNNLGEIKEAWVPAETGSYLLHLWTPKVFDVSLPIQTDLTGLDGSTNLVEYFEVEKRPIELSVDYVPDEPTLDDEVTMITSVFDAALGEPADGLYVDFFIYGLTLPEEVETYIYLGWALTNSSGVAVYSFVPRTYYEEYNLFPYFYVVAVCSETCYTLESDAFVLLDTRYPTALEFLGDDAIYAPVGRVLPLGCRLVRADTGEPIVDKPIQIYMNDTWQGAGFTEEDGICSFSITIYVSGLYFFRAQFSWGEEYLDVLYEDSDNVTFVIVAEAVPVFVLFEVQPGEFAPGTPVTLSATVLNATSNLSLQGFEVWFYWYANNGTMGIVGSDVTDTQRIASVTWTYPEGGVYIFWARVSEAQQVVSSPVTLTVGKKTELSMNVEKGDGFNYTFSGRLLCSGVPVANKQVALKVNGTVVAVAVTSGDGGYSVALNLQVVDDKPTSYQIEVVFYGDDALNLTGYAVTPNGTEYAVCTTLQYFGYKPACNATWLTVEPQATQVLMSTKTPEEIQAEAEAEGWLKPPEPRFSLWYPWFRLHFVMVFDGEDILDVGLSPLGCDLVVPYQPFDSWINDAINEVIVKPIAKALFIGWIMSEIAVFAGMHLGPVGFAAVLVGSVISKGLLLLSTLDSVEGLKGSFVGTCFSWAYGFITALKEVVGLGIACLTDFLKIGELSFWKLVFKFIYIPLNMYFLMRIVFRVVELGGW